MSSIEVLSPRAGSALPVDRLRLADRPGVPRPARMLLVDNGKQLAPQLLESLARELAGEIELVDVKLHHKGSPAVILESDELDELAQGSDLIVTAIGDCGACSSCSLHDALEFERRGVPSLLVITEPFQETIASLALRLGAPDYQPLVVPHPISSRSRSELDSLAVEVAEVAGALLSQPPDAATGLARP